MTDAQALVRTLDFKLDIQSDNESLLYDATLVKNTTQRVVAKALGAMENYYEYDDFGQPSHTKDGAYPLRANYEEGYNLSLTDDGDVRSASARNRTSTSRAFSKATTPTSTFSKPHSKATSGRLGRRKPCSTTTTPSCTSTLPTPSRPFETSRTHGRSSVWT